MSDDGKMPIGVKVILVLSMIAIVGAILFTVFISGCDVPPQQPRTTPFAVWCFEDAKGLADSTGFDYLLPDAYYKFGDVITMPNRWNVFQFIVPRRDMLAAYKFQWAAPGSTYRTLCIVAVDTVDSGILWIAVDGIQDGDKVKLVLP